MKKKRKKRGKFIPLNIKNPSVLLEHYNNFDSLMELTSILEEIKQEAIDAVRESTRLFKESFTKHSAKKIGDKVLSETYNDPKKLIKEVTKILKDKAKIGAIQLSINDAFQNLNRGELIAAKASKLSTVKTWRTQFDSRVREWHAQVNFLEVLVGEKFTVPYPKGVDYLEGPKIPPISVENFINCRCYLEYSIIE